MLVTCERCGEDVESDGETGEGVSNWLPPHTSGFQVESPPRWMLCPHCRDLVDEAWSQIDAAVERIGRGALDIAVKFNPFLFAP